MTLQLPRRPLSVAVLPTMGSPFAKVDPVHVGAMQSELRITLVRLTPIRGRLLDPDGNAIPVGFIRVERERAEHEWIYSSVDGNFLVRVPSGTRVTLRFDGTIQEHDTKKQKLLPLQAVNENVVAGNESVVLRARPMAIDRKLSARVLDPDGVPAEGIPLYINVPPADVRRGTSNAQGLVLWENLPALKLLVGSFWNATPDQPWLLERPSVVADGQEITLQFRRGVTATGTLLREDGTALVGGSVQIFSRGVPRGSAATDERGIFVVVFDPERVEAVTLKVSMLDPSGVPLAAEAKNVRPGEIPTLRLKRVKYVK